MKKISFKKTGILLVMILVAGAILAMPVSAAEAQTGITETKQSVHLSVNEFTPWNSEGAKTIEDKINSILAQPLDVRLVEPTTYNLNYIRTDTLQTDGDKYSSASGTYKLYKVDLPDSNYDYYILWMKATGMNNDDGLISSYLREVKPGITLNRYSDGITDWEPFSDTATSSTVSVTVDLGVTHGVGTAGISETFDIQKGHVGPDELNTGHYGYFKPHWDGNYQGSQGIIGGAEFRVPKGSSYSYDLSLSVTGAGY
jgi:hypothetical protein